MAQFMDISVPADIGDKFVRQLRHLIPILRKECGFAGDYLSQEVFSKFLDSTALPWRSGSPSTFRLSSLTWTHGTLDWASRDFQLAGEAWEKAEPLKVKELRRRRTPAGIRKQAAVDKFLAVERRNLRTNQRLYWDTPDWSWVEYDSFLEMARSIVRDILGPMRYPAVLGRASYTNGASTRVRRSPFASSEKLTGEVQITAEAVKHWLAMAGNTILSQQDLSLVESSSLFTVPKNSKIDRCACKEPEGNMLLQRSVGIYIRDRLRVHNIDLRDQSRNRDMAQRAVGLGLATLDLSSASDTLTEQLVTLLLPPEWCWLLDDLRVKSTQIERTTHSLAMFSSMGNGFTFELETLIFYALARTTAWASKVKGHISVYGDDIIVPISLARRFMRVLSWFGFTPNPKKTHCRGPFREACGGHYWNGFDVTPFYVRREVRTLPDMINILNSLLEWDCRGWGLFTTEEAFRFWSSWIEYIPKSIWGGIDPRDPSSLVTGHAPRKRIVPVTEVEVPAHVVPGQLRDWLHRSERRGPLTNPVLTDLEEADWLSPLMEYELSVDPRVVRKFKRARVVSRGERTAFYPQFSMWSLEPDEPAKDRSRWGP